MGSDGAGEEGGVGKGLDGIIPAHSCPQGSSLADFQVSSPGKPRPVWGTLAVGPSLTGPFLASRGHYKGRVLLASVDHRT